MTKSGSVAAKIVRKQSKSSAPIFFEKTIVRMIKKYAPPKTRVTPGASRLLRTILEQKAIHLAKKAYTVTKVRSGKQGNVRAMSRDAQLVLSLQ
jgi:histone H3/H4